MSQDLLEAQKALEELDVRLADVARELEQLQQLQVTALSSVHAEPMQCQHLISQYIGLAESAEYVRRVTEEIESRVVLDSLDCQRLRRLRKQRKRLVEQLALEHAEVPLSRVFS